MPSIHENLQHTMTADVIQPAQRGVDALDIAHNAVALSQGLFEGVVGDEKNSDLHQSAELMAHVNQKLTEALEAMAQISEKTHRIMEKVGIEVPPLRLPSPPLVTQIRPSVGAAAMDVEHVHTGDGPLDIVRDILTTHTDRNPADNAAIVDMMHQALSESGADLGAFSDELINVLDPHTEQALSAQTVAVIANLGALIIDESAPRGARWGALSLIGAIALGEQSGQDDTQEVAAGDGAHAHLTRHVARQALMTVMGTEALDDSYRVSAHALLSQKGFSTEDIAVDLAIGGFHESGQEPEVQPAAAEPEADTEELRIMGASVSDVRQESIFSLGPDVKAKIEAMDWLKLGNDAVGDVRDIVHDGEVIARVVDLTTTHTLFNSLKDRLVGHHKLGQHFWRHLATSIIHFSKSQKIHRMQGAKVPTYYMKNTKTANENIFRAYYVPMGRSTDGITVFGLVAAYHTKNSQRQVLSIIGDSRHRPTISE